MVDQSKYFPRGIEDAILCRCHSANKIQILYKFRYFYSRNVKYLDKNIFLSLFLSFFITNDLLIYLHYLF